MFRLELIIFTLYRIITWPIVWIAAEWSERMEALASLREMPEEAAGGEATRTEPTVADIQPAGIVNVHAMDAEGKWHQLHDYPVRLLSKVPGIEIRGGEKQ